MMEQKESIAENLTDFTIELDRRSKAYLRGLKKFK